MSTRCALRMAIVTLGMTFVLLQIPCGEGDASAKPSVRPGDRVRITVSGPAIQADSIFFGTKVISPWESVPVLQGRLGLVEPDSIVLTDEAGWSLLVVSTNSIERLEVLTEGSHKVAGAIIGLVAGGLIGAAVGSSMDDTDSQADCEPGAILCDDFQIIDYTAQGAFLGGLTGMAFGAVIGLSCKTERWESVDKGHLQTGLRITDGGAVFLTLSTRF